MLNGPRWNYYFTGELEAQEGYMNGRLEGPSERFYENGQLATLATYIDGYMYGPYEVYHPDGALYSGGTLEHNEPCGEWVEKGTPATYSPCPPPDDSR